MGGGRMEECARVVSVSSMVVIVSTSLPVPVLAGVVGRHCLVEVFFVIDVGEGGPCDSSLL